MKNSKENLKFYGVIDFVEKYNNNGEKGYYVTIDCLESKKFDELFLENRNTVSILDVIEDIENEYLFLDIPIAEVTEFLDFKIIDKIEGKWVKVYSTKTDSKFKISNLSQFLVNETSSNSNYNFELINDRNERRLNRKLKKTFDLAITCESFVSKENAINELNKIKPKNLSDVNVICYNVGQGNAVCINETNTINKISKPLMYFDIGGGANFNKFTYPHTRAFIAEEDTLIVLSHWDEDHYETANIDNNLVNNKTYIAPVQTVTPRNLKFVNKIIRNGILILLPIDFTNHTFAIGTIERCKGNKNNKNDCGLALTLELKKENDISTILLPGDAQYKYITSLKKNKYDGLLATHHGGRLRPWIIMPLTSNGNGCVAYSYGLINNHRNTYGHPLIDSINSHQAAGWGIFEGNERNNTMIRTENGDVIFSFFNKEINCTQNNINLNSFNNLDAILNTLL